MYAYLCNKNVKQNCCFINSREMSNNLFPKSKLILSQKFNGAKANLSHHWKEIGAFVFHCADFSELFYCSLIPSGLINMAGKMTSSMEDAPRSMREIVQKKFLDEVIGAAGKNSDAHFSPTVPFNISVQFLLVIYDSLICSTTL